MKSAPTPLFHSQRTVLEGIDAALEPLDCRLAIAERPVDDRQRRGQPVRPRAAGLPGALQERQILGRRSSRRAVAHSPVVSQTLSAEAATGV